MTHETASTIVDAGGRQRADAPTLRPPKPPPGFNRDLPNSNRSSVSKRRLLAGPPWDRRRRRLRRRRGRQINRQEKLTPESKMSTTPKREPEIDTVLVAGRTGGPVPSLHVPGDDGEPICHISLDDRMEQPGSRGGPCEGKDRWREKDVSVYPGPWRDWCKSCLAVLETERVS